MTLLCQWLRISDTNFVVPPLSPPWKRRWPLSLRCSLTLLSSAVLNLSSLFSCFRCQISWKRMDGIDMLSVANKTKLLPSDCYWGAKHLNLNLNSSSSSSSSSRLLRHDGRLVLGVRLWVGRGQTVRAGGRAVGAGTGTRGAARLGPHGHIGKTLNASGTFRVQLIHHIDHSLGLWFRTWPENGTKPSENSFVKLGRTRKAALYPVKKNKCRCYGCGWPHPPPRQDKFFSTSHLSLVHPPATRPFRWLSVLVFCWEYWNRELSGSFFRLSIANPDHFLTIHPRLISSQPVSALQKIQMKNKTSDFFKFYFILLPLNEIGYDVDISFTVFKS